MTELRQTRDSWVPIPPFHELRDPGSDGPLCSRAPTGTARTPGAQPLDLSREHTRVLPAARNTARSQWVLSKHQPPLLSLQHVPPTVLMA